MAPTRTLGPSSKVNTVVALWLIVVCCWPVRGLPLNGQALDSAVEGVQKYLESSGFPKMTRGEILDFLNDFSRNSRVSRSEKTSDGGGMKYVGAVARIPRGDETRSGAFSRPEIARDESPLAYGYPMSSVRSRSERTRESTTPTIFVTVGRENSTSDANEKNGADLRAISSRRSAQKKSVAPSVDLNAYAKFKKIPEARNVKIDDDMKSFLDGFGLLDAPKSVGSGAPPLRRNDGNAIGAATTSVTTESVDERLLESLLLETGHANASARLRPFVAHDERAGASSSRDLHVFNPSSSNVKTVDVNRIAKIVENIRLLTDGNDTVASLSPHDAFQKKLENITAAIAAIDRPTDDSREAFNGGYEVFFDDGDDATRETDSDLPESPTGGLRAGAGTEPLDEARNPPDPLSADELQRLVEKNKSDVKRQQPATTAHDDAATTPSVSASSERAVEIVTAAVTVADSTSDGTSTEASSDAGGESRDSSTTAATDTNPSLSQLAESFGGGDTASSPPPAGDDSATVAPNRPKNGLYFYVDWNTFLTVNEGQKNQVNLRFAPKAGNPAHFIKIAVP